ncbi:LysM peptidoglycan-binding domain-containing protein [Nibribacter ruber]|uniref:LysM peptidoglycan-binding domain-containing protein n=1 Tax=Nibribacter ruber TaxID=2698458 RepID=A0A6P1NU08_9BACT|nr:LysM peptidoglycan-binding domain-containing protein [Nibribacter ruber]QHL87356.1 LysM peptidoglycan-binding domain-containing protein [Nibribacter ruber]
MRKLFPLLLLCLFTLAAQAQNPIVPYTIHFADMRLTIKEDARVEIQKIVDGLVKHPGYFQKKVELADAYFPHIEQAFKQENLPLDFKYLALQESGLVSDAVSTSNAVGFWQFKETSATELGVRVNSQVDERKHIIESSRGAAKYLHRSNNYYKNWFNTLLSYYQGLTGTKALTKTSDIGVKEMDVTSQTNRYLLTFLAHKVAYENAIGRNPKPTLALQPMKVSSGQSLTEIAMAAQVEAGQLEQYNKWLLASTVPADKDYYVMVPVFNGSATTGVLAQDNQRSGPLQKLKDLTESITGRESKEELEAKVAGRRAQFTQTNGLKAIIAQVGDTKDVLALQAHMPTRRFLRYNDMRSFDEIVPGRTYYLQAKRSKSDTDYHVARTGETMHDVSQKYGMKLSNLLRKNRMKKNEALLVGRVLWLQQNRPSNIPVEIRHLNEDVAPTVVSTATPAQKPATTVIPARPQEGAITVMVEDTLGMTAVVKGDAPAPKPAPVDSVVVTTTVTTNAVLYPTKQMGADANKPERPIEVKSPEVNGREVLTSATTTTTTSAVPAKPTAPVNSASFHVVQKGETLYSISKLYNVSMENLQTWNHLNGGPLSVGKELSLKGPISAEAAAKSSPVMTASEAKAAAREHVVVAGETLYSISRKYGITIQNLLEWNNLTDNSPVSIGQKLVVIGPSEEVTAVETKPAATVAPLVEPVKTASGTITHKVAAGESMYQISRKYGVTIKEIMEWNNKADFNVSLGENLTIKPKVASN